MFETELVLTKIESRLKTRLTSVSHPNASIRVMSDEVVPPGAGEEFISIRPGGTSNVNPPAHPTKDFLHSFIIGITRRMQGVPNEQGGVTVLTHNPAHVDRLKPSMYARGEEIATLLEEQNGWSLLAEINASLPSTGRYLVPFGLVSVDPRIEKVGEEHFDVEASRQHGLRYVGLLLELEFGGAEYLLVT